MAIRSRIEAGSRRARRRRHGRRSAIILRGANRQKSVRTRSSAGVSQA
jgi:hypothetical protein